jgi:hypothetical protein
MNRLVEINVNRDDRPGVLIDPAACSLLSKLADQSNVDSLSSTSRRKPSCENKQASSCQLVH